ncbi:phosphatidylinositol alpha-1,6-mannosyltransferase [Paenibacillus cellulosilyticus]|uniref:Phosphatidylinositol alpha-1,6-mannosyltransferase n=1 Tax=Paenibacillus cellulosilyticus TaxID=375489 RepID=A0A2V2YWB4_9BACL|nr:glycosyltransferase family 4 protein [Paenibacillus cellulosilyticus]PWW05046.1 phosphatidylinositol alpha-1,6-mannosyltransferase [Paenibacillus cellulosilyticus]QKS48603.1 glycosyltransferase family 4 protein [Paenibacillus cellulosilyticus]
MSRKIVLVTGVFPPGIGGMQNYYYNLSKYSKHHMTVLASEYPECVSFDKGQPFRIVRGSFMRGESVDFTSWGRLFRHVRRLLRSEEPDVTVYGYVLIGFIGLLLKIFSGRRYVISTHGMDMLMFRKYIGLNQIVKLILRKADGVLTNSEYTRKRVEDYGVDPSRIGLVNPGVEAIFDRQEKNAELLKQHDLEGKHVILTVGRLVRRKGHDRVIESMPAILQQIPNAIYVIVGDGPERGRLEQLAKTTGVSEAVRFVGNVSGSERLNDYYNLADQFIMACRELEEGDVEGFGIVYLEAASAGVPVIAGKSGGASEAVLDGTTGLIVTPESHAEITAAVVRLASDTVLRESLVLEGYKRAKTQFQHENLAETFDLYIGRLCARPLPGKKRAKKPAIQRMR